MAVLKLAISTARPDTFLESNFESVTGGKEICQRLINYITGLFTGSESAMSTSIPPQIAISIQENEVRASGTLTCVSVIATNTVLINGVEFAAVDSGPTGNQFVRTADNAVTATNLAAKINASATALIAGYVTAVAVTNVVTVTSSFYGLAGNQVTMSTTGGTITSSVTRLASGAVDATAQTLQF